MARLPSPQASQLPIRGDLIGDESGQAVARRLGGALPDCGRETMIARACPPQVRGHVAHHERHDRIFSQCLAQVPQNLAYEAGVVEHVAWCVEGRVHGGGIFAKEPQAEPVGGSVADGAQIRRAGQDEAGTVGKGPRP
jgi:hypothetical protein